MRINGSRIMVDKVTGGVDEPKSLNTLHPKKRDNPVKCLSLGQQAVKVAYHFAGVGGWKKQMLTCNE